MFVDRRSLAGVDRGHIQGFKKYWSQRQGDFRNIYHADYSNEAAEKEFGRMGL
jgi:hypothetical protein